MKPVNLKIKGFKSFIEEQEIDFEQLTVNNLFGIAGATRSGKTSILDALILSLYGNLKKTSSVFNYVNLKSEAAHLEFTFELMSEGKRRTFCIKRVFKIKNRTHTAELFEITPEGKIALESNTTKATKYIIDLLGLDMEDFTQVVIMQQGEFDKFIKSGHAKRNEIIGRIFHLDKYGDKLNERIKLRRNTINNKLSELKGRIEANGAVTAEDIKRKERDYKEKTKLINELSAKCVTAQSRAEQLKLYYTDYINRLERTEEIAKAEAELTARQVRKTNAENNYSAVNKEVSAEKQQIKTGYESLTAAKEKLNSAREDYSAKTELENKRKLLLADYAELRKTAEENRAVLEKIKLENIQLAEKNKKILQNFAQLITLDGEDIEPAKVFIVRAEEEEKRITALKTDAAELEKTIKKMTEKYVLNESVHAKTLADEEADKRRANILAEQIRRADRECGETAQAVNVIFKHVHQGDLCPVCGGIVGDNRAKEISEESRSEYAAAVTSLAEINLRLEDFRALIPVRALEIDNLRKSLAENDEKLSDINAKIGLYKPFPLDRLKEDINWFSDNKKLITENEKKSLALSAEIKVTEESLRNAEERGRENSERIELLNTKINRIIPDGFLLAQAKIESEEIELNTRADRADKKLEYSRGELEDAVKAAAELDAGLKAHKKELLAIKTDKAVTREELAQAAQELSAVTEEKERGSRELNYLERDISTDKQRLETNKIDEAARKEYQKKSDLLESLSGLIKGKELLNFMAEEYIQSFTKNASKRLHELTLGQYTLLYTDEFQVVDNFNGGKERGVDTLSGGETFLVSLSLAVAISQEIADTRQFEFFFIDEGFGTLDADLVEMVLGCLELLKHSGFNIGLISHRQELMQKIVVKLIISPATDEHGSIVSTVY